MTDEGINLDQVDESSFSLVPGGRYPATILRIDRTPTKDGASEYLKLEVVLDGERYANKHIWDNLCVFHQKETPRNIARQQFKQLCLAIGKKPNDYISFLQGDLDETFIGESLVVEVGMEEGKGGYSDKNVIRKYLPSGIETSDEAKKEDRRNYGKSENDSPIEFSDDDLSF